MEFSAERFWYFLTLACIVWYSTITVFVAVKGAFDIRNMLARIKGGGELKDPGQGNGE